MIAGRLVQGLRAALLTGAALLGSPALAQDLAPPPAPLLRVEGLELPRGLSEDLLALARLEQPSLALPDLLQRLALEWLLGEDARRRVGDEQLFSARRVAFEPAAMVERQWQALAWQRWPQALAQDWDRWQRQARVIEPASAAAWQHFLQQAAGSGRLADGSKTAAPAAAQLVLLRWCERADCRAPSTLTLAQVWPALNVQGRTLALAGDREFARQQARRWLQDRFTRDWASQSERWGRQGAEALQSLLWARVRWQALLRWEGLDGDAHAAAQGAGLAPAGITDADIERYWREHPEEFRRISRLDGWRMRCADAACREAVEPFLRQHQDLARLQSRRLPGLSVQEVHWSDEGGDAASAPAAGGTPTVSGALDEWSLALMAVTPVGAPSAALRHPGVEARGWEWVQVQRREERLQVLQSETVRYQAMQALMQQRRQAAWRERQEQLLAGAQLQWAPGLAAPSQSPLLGLEARAPEHHHD